MPAILGRFRLWGLDFRDVGAECHFPGLYPAVLMGPLFSCTGRGFLLHGSEVKCRVWGLGFGV